MNEILSETKHIRVVFTFFTFFWSSVFAFVRINHAAQPPQSLKTSCMLKMTTLSKMISFISIFIHDDRARLRFDDCVAVFTLFRTKTWGPCNKCEVLERNKIDFTSGWLKGSKSNRSIRFLFVVKLY